jgi:hypothetical protein
MKTSKTRQDHIDFDQNYCAHYKPKPGAVRSDYCALGCGASERMDAGRKAGQPNMTPCIGGHKAADVLALCPKWERRSMEHSIARADSFEEMFKRMEIVDPVVTKWRTIPKPATSRAEVIECPVCKGRLHLSQSSYNGHVHAKCETADCVAFME